MEKKDEEEEAKEEEGKEGMKEEERFYIGARRPGFSKQSPNWPGLHTCLSLDICCLIFAIGRV